MIVSHSPPFWFQIYFRWLRHLCYYALCSTSNSVRNITCKVLDCVGNRTYRICEHNERRLYNGVLSQDTPYGEYRMQWNLNLNIDFCKDSSHPQNQLAWSSLGLQFPLSQRIILPSSPGSSSPRTRWPIYTKCCLPRIRDRPTVSGQVNHAMYLDRRRNSERNL